MHPPEPCLRAQALDAPAGFAEIEIRRPLSFKTPAHAAALVAELLGAVITPTDADFEVTPTAPTASSDAAGLQLVTAAWVRAFIAALVGAAPEALDTLAEIAARIQSGDNALAALTATVGGKLAKASNLADLTNAATALDNLGASTLGKALFAAASAAAARVSLGLGTAAVVNLDASNRFASDAEKAEWSAKQPALSNAATLAKITENAGLPLWNGAAWPGGSGAAAASYEVANATARLALSGAHTLALHDQALQLSDFTVWLVIDPAKAANAQGWLSLGAFLRAPAFTANPVASGNVAVGNVLSCNTGTAPANPAAAFSYNWQRSADGGATWGNPQNTRTASTYTVGSAEGAGVHCFRCTVTATNTHGSASAYSNALVQVGEAPTVSGVMLSAGTFTVGRIGVEHSVSATITGAPSPSLSYSWRANNNPAPPSVTDWDERATSATYTPTGSDDGYFLACIVTATNSEGTASADNGQSVVCGYAGNVSGASLSFTVGGAGVSSVAVGETVAAVASAYNPPGASVSFLWNVGGSTAPEVSVPEGLESVECTATISTAWGSDTLSGSLPVASPPYNTVAPSISGGASWGDYFTATAGTWIRGGDTNYQWQVSVDDSSWEDISGANNSYLESYTGGQFVRVRVSRTNTYGAAEAYSNSLPTPTP